MDMDYDLWLEEPYEDVADDDLWVEWCEENGEDPKTYTPEDHYDTMEAEAADARYDRMKEEGF